MKIKPKAIQKYKKSHLISTSTSKKIFVIM